MTRMIEGFFGVWNFRFGYFFGWLDLSRDFLGIKTSKIRSSTLVGASSVVKMITRMRER